MSPAAPAKGLLNYTTTVTVDRTLSEMQSALGRAGARRLMIEWDDGAPSALSFGLDGPHGERFYTLPCDASAVHRILQEQAAQGIIDARASRGYTTYEHAQRVAWRVLKDWLEAQLALISTRMATLDQVMLPYVHVDRDRTLYAAWAEHEALGLPPGQT